MLKKFFKSFGVGLVLLMSSQLHADIIYDYQISSPPGAAFSGQIANVATSFNKTQQQLSFSTQINDANIGAQTHRAEGGWLVLTPGGSPWEDAAKYAVFYLDFLNQRVSAYEYLGGFLYGVEESYVSGAYLGSIPGTFSQTANQVGVSFELDTSIMNANNSHSLTEPSTWLGAQFAESLGIMLHLVNDANFTYDADGKITDFAFLGNTYFVAQSITTRVTDTGIPPVSVPEPSMLILMLGMLMFMLGVKPNMKKMS